MLAQTPIFFWYHYIVLSFIQYLLFFSPVIAFIPEEEPLMPLFTIVKSNYHHHTTTTAILFIPQTAGCWLRNQRLQLRQPLLPYVKGLRGAPVAVVIIKVGYQTFCFSETRDSWWLCERLFRHVSECMRRWILGYGDGTGRGGKKRWSVISWGHQFMGISDNTSTRMLNGDFEGRRVIWNE